MCYYYACGYPDCPDCPGCPDYTPPSHTWTEKRDGYIIVGCVNTNDQWKIRSISNHWLGPLRDCSLCKLCQWSSEPLYLPGPGIEPRLLVFLLRVISVLLIWPQ